MADDLAAQKHPTQGHSRRVGGVPLLVAIVIAIAGVLGILLVDHGSWNKPKVQTATVANYSTTGDAARAAGATVMPTEAKPQIEPDSPGPKPVNLANPTTP